MGGEIVTSQDECWLVRNFWHIYTYILERQVVLVWLVVTLCFVLHVCGRVFGKRRHLRKRCLPDIDGWFGLMFIMLNFSRDKDGCTPNSVYSWHLLCSLGNSWAFFLGFPIGGPRWDRGYIPAYPLKDDSRSQIRMFVRCPDWVPLVWWYGMIQHPIPRMGWWRCLLGSPNQPVLVRGYWICFNVLFLLETMTATYLCLKARHSSKILPAHIFTPNLNWWIPGIRSLRNHFEGPFAC